MQAIGIILFVAAMIINVYYGIILVIKAFEESALWGLAYLFVPFAALAFLVIHWDKAGQPFLRSLLTIPLVIAAMFFISMSGAWNQQF